MNCHNTRDILIDLLYDELDASARRAAEEHLALCPACRGEFEKLRLARRGLAIRRGPEAPAGGVASRAFGNADGSTRRTEGAPPPHLGASRLPARMLRRRRLTAVGGIAAALALAIGLWVIIQGPVAPVLGRDVEIRRLNVSLTILSVPEWATDPRQHQGGFGQQRAQQTEQAMAQMPARGRISPRWRGPWAGLALVRDQRVIRNLPRGQTEVRFTDVPAGILPDTVRLRALDDPDALAIGEQNYQYDLASAGAVLRRYVDRPVTAVFADGGQVTGDLLSFDAGSLLVRPPGAGPRTLTRSEVASIVLPDLPEGLRTRPTLCWKLRNDGPRRQQFEVAYMTRGLKWRADYVLKLHPGGGQSQIGDLKSQSTDLRSQIRDLKPETFDRADLVGYATVSNHSGVTYEHAQLKLLAGDVNLVREERQDRDIRTWTSSFSPRDQKQPQFREKAFFEYHLYTLSRPTTLASAETKQIELVSGSGVRMRRLYVYDRTVNATAPRVVSELTNSEANGLGKPLPKGVVRLYAPDPTGRQTYVSQTTIDHTPKDEKIRLPWAFAFDIVCDARRTDYKRRGQWDHYEKWEYSLRNHKDRDVTITVHVRVPAATYKFECPRPWKVPAVGLVEIDVPVKANTAGKLTFSYRWNTRSGGGLTAPRAGD